MSIGLHGHVATQGPHALHGLLAGREQFSPADITDLEAWYDADQIEGLSDTDAVSQWNDESGADRHVTQATAAQQPTYRTGIIGGKPVVRFDGVDDVLRRNFGVGLSQPNTVFVVGISRNADSEVGNFFDARGSSSNTSNRHIMGATSTGTFRWRIFAGSAIETADSVRDSDPHIFTAHFDTTSSTLRQDGTQVVSGDAGSQTWWPISLGRAERTDNIMQQLDGDIAEVIVYSRTLTAQERDQVESYLSGKYGITL